MEYIRKNRKKLLIIIGVLLIVTLGVSYAYFSVGGKQEEFITFNAGCLSITITEESEEINLDKVLPVTVEEGLNYEPYTFTIKNNCSTTSPYQVAVESLNMTDNTMGIENIQVSLEDSKGRIITERLDKLDSTNISVENSYDARKIFNGELEGNSTTFFKFRMWLDYDATVASAAGKTYQSKIVITARDNVELTEEVIKIAYQEENSTEGLNGWYKSYTTKGVITDRKDNNITARYCVGKEVCTPDKDIKLENNSFEFIYPNGSNYLCVIASDSKGNRSTVTCNEVIKVDTNKPSVKYTIGENTAGSNNWYKNLKVRVEGEDAESGVSSLKYCVTTESTCEPTSVVNGTSTEVTMSSNAAAQKICTKATDKNGNESEVICSNTYKVDTLTPTVAVSVASSTAGSNSWYKALSIKGQGSSSYSGVASIKYCTTTSSTCTPSTNVTGTNTTVALTSNASAQKVCFQAIANSGRTSYITCSDAYKVDTSTTTVSFTPTLPTVGTNSWYKSGSIKITGNNSYSKVASVKYCTTTSSTCTPSTNVTGTNTTVTLTSNGSAQKVCATATDNKGTTTRVTCSSAYKIDTTKPTVSISSTSVTTNSITMNVSKTEAHSGIKSYYYKIGNGSYGASTSTSKTFTGLASNTSYTIYVYAIDNAGNQSTVASKTVTTQKTASQTILGGITAKPGSTSFTGVATTNEGVFTGTDNDGTTYYWRGAVTNNYLKFANKWWRIIRINGDGTIRIIYDGTAYHANGTSTTDSQIGTSKFNSSYNDNAYVGFMYGAINQSTYAATHTNTNKSTIMTTLETWYTNNLASYASKIDTNAGFCGDRSINTGSETWLESDTKKGFGTNVTAYGPYGRLFAYGSYRSTQTATFKCSNSNDLYTVKGASKGNKAIDKPIGLIAMDEVMYAGGFGNKSNTSYYLYNGQQYWTMSSCCHSVYARVFFVSPGGHLGQYSVHNADGVRPVINLRADVTITGSGTQNDPYVVS